MANAKKIVGIVLLVIGSIWFVLSISAGYIFFGRFFSSTFTGLVVIIPGLCLLLASRKKYSKSPDTNL